MQDWILPILLAVIAILAIGLLVLDFNPSRFDDDDYPW